MSYLTIHIGDWVECLRQLPDQSIHCCVTSPPYWGLRDYGTAVWKGGDSTCNHRETELRRGVNLSQSAASTRGGGHKIAEAGWIQYKDKCARCGAVRVDRQLGLEKTPEEYVSKIVEGFREVRRVLRDDGTLWLNLGDTYNFGKSRSALSCRGGYEALFAESDKISRKRTGQLKVKDLIGIPWRVAFALQADGWYLRSDIIWQKPNPMPESVTDRPTKSHEYIFLLTKSHNYYYDAEAIKEPVTGGAHPRTNGKHSRMMLERAAGREGSKPNPSRAAINAVLHNQTSALRARNGTKRNPTKIVNGMRPRVPGVGPKSAEPGSGIKANSSFNAAMVALTARRNKRSVWTVATAPYKQAHFATFPPKLIEPCILAGTSAKGCCPKCGAPWKRIIEKITFGKVDYNGKHSDQNYAGRNMLATCRAARLAGAPHDGPFSGTKTLGWKPTCNCQSDMGIPITPIPCTVLDPFGGSGTTGMVALEHGRKSILIELNVDYVEMGKVRCDITPALPLA